MENIIEVNGLTKHYSGFSLKNISFKVPGGAIMGLVGENGAGKTTTIKALIGLIHKDGGKVRILGKDMDKDGPRVREDVGVVLDGSGFHETLKLRDIPKFMSKIYKDWDWDYFLSLCKNFNLPENKVFKEFSTGMRMKLMIAVTMAHHPKLLILDEATSGLDPVVRDEILDMLLDFIQDEEHSVLISSHITSDLEKIADYITFIHKGEIFLSENKDRIMENFGIVRCRPEEAEIIEKKHIIGMRQGNYSWDVMVDNRAEIMRQFPRLIVDKINLEDVLLYKVKGEN